MKTPSSKPAVAWHAAKMLATSGGLARIAVRPWAEDSAGLSLQVRKGCDGDFCWNLSRAES